MTKQIKKAAVVLTAVSLAAVSFTGCSSKKEYPSKDISVVCPYSAGGTTDLCIRGLIEAVPDDAKPSGVNITVSNVTGGGGLVGTTQFKNADADGYTLGIVNCDLVLNKVNGNTDISYDEFTPVACLMNQPNLLLVKADAPYDTFEEFVDYAKAHPGEVKIGNSGEGTIPKLSAQAIEKGLGLEFKYVTYDGDTNSITAVVSGEVDATCCSAAPAMGQLNAETIKVLTVTDNKRMESFPDVPAMGELYEELAETRILTWVYLAVRNDVPAENIKYLQDMFAKAGANESFAETQKSFSIEKTTFEGTDQVKEFMKQQYAFYEELIK